jgi:hypothetical protein
LLQQNAVVGVRLLPHRQTLTHGGDFLMLQVISNEIAHKMNLLQPTLWYSQLQIVRLRESAAKDPSLIFRYSYEAILLNIMLRTADVETFTAVMCLFILFSNCSSVFFN